MYYMWVFCLAVASAAPIQDTQIVESTVREVRAIAPKDLQAAADNYKNDYAADDDGTIGYLKKSSDGGSDGYKHFDSFHKKDGDKYGYEKHTAFGKVNKYTDDGEGKGNDKKAKATEHSYQVAEELNEYDDGPAGQLSEYSFGHDGEDGESKHYEGDSGHYTDGESSSYDDGESQKYTNEGDNEEYSADDGEEDY